MDIVESIHDLPMQDPPLEEFSSIDLKWTLFGTIEHCDNVAIIPYSRVDHFILGECLNVECPTQFHIEKGRKRPVGSLKVFKSDEYLEYRLYWCSFGPENYGEGSEVLPSRRYRLNTRNRAPRPQSMRGCTCHFVVKRLYARPSLALIVYNERRHINKSGFVCHGPLDKDAIGPGAKRIPYICNEIQQQTLSMMYLGMPEENVLEKHIEGVERYCGSNTKVKALASQYVHKLGMIIKRCTHELDLDDETSIRMWVDRNKKSVFFYQSSSETDPFILGIQTDWQLQQMVRFGNWSLMAANSTFGVKKLKYPLSTLLVFDSRQHALPIAWIITRSFTKTDLCKWMKALFTRARNIEPGWKICAFIIDDAAAELDPVRDTFCCPILFSLWRVRRSWLRKIIKNCDNLAIQREIFKHLGEIVYGIWGGVDSFISLEEFLKEFVDQREFIRYFKASWVPKLEMWLASMKSLPLASLEAAGAIEEYHVKLKSKLYVNSHLESFQRVDWLVHKLTTELHSSYWLDRYADESDSFQNVKHDYIASSSWYQALQIPDSMVSYGGHGSLFTKVSSTEDSSKIYTVWNPGSEFSFCDCNWSKQGNLCKHIIKVNMIGESQPACQSSLSLYSFKAIVSDLYRRPVDDSIALDRLVSWAHQMFNQVRRIVDLSGSNDICSIVRNHTLQWDSKKRRTSFKKPVPILALPSACNATVSSRRKNPKRKRLSRLM